jgi:hypothetical protein
MVQCNAKRYNGERCKRSCKKGEKYCPFHYELIDKEDFVVKG